MKWGRSTAFLALFLALLVLLRIPALAQSAAPIPVPTAVPVPASGAASGTASSAPTAAPVVAPVSPTPAATPVLQSPITQSNTDVPPVPTEVIPTDNVPASNTPSAAAQQFADPNRVLPAPPVVKIGPSLPARPEVAASSPAPGAPNVPTAPNPALNSIPAGHPVQLPEVPGGGDVQSGTEKPGGKYSLEASNPVVYDQDRGLAISEGDVIFRYGEFAVRGDRGLIDFNTNRAVLTGNLTLMVRGQKFFGKSLAFDLDSGQWRLSSLSTTFPPEFFPPGTVLSPLYVRDGDVVGDADKFAGENFKFTSCDRDHYYIKSRKLEFYRQPDGQPSRIVLRHNYVYVLGHKLLPLPVYVISLLGATSRRQPLQATFGQNVTDGYFVRSVYDLRATDKITDSLLVDALQKRGLGLGLQRLYPATAGIFYLYVLSSNTGGREIDSNIDRTFRLASNLTSNVKFQSTQNNSLTGEGVQSQNGQFSFSRAGDQAQTNAVFAFSRSTFGTDESKNGSISVDHHQDIGSGLSIDSNSLLSRSQSGTGAGSDAATGDETFVVTKNTNAFDVFLRTELHEDLVTNKSYQLQRLPELTLQSSTERLPLPGLSQFLPGSFTFGLGRFSEPTTDSNGDATTQQKDRADFNYNTTGKSIRLLGNGDSKSVLNATGSFEQAFYSDNTARYNYAYSMSMNNKAGPAQLQLNYSKQRTFGFTPFQFDFSTPGEYLDYTFSLQPSPKYRLNLSGGRDIQNDYNRDLILRMQVAPNAGFYASLGTSYRLQPDTPGLTSTSKFGDIYANIRVARSRNRFGGGALALGVRYSPDKGLARANGSLDVNLGKKTRVQALVGYDGFGKTFDFTQFRVTRDLHCFNLYATYDGQAKEFRIDVALKAFPFADTRFGRNQFSEGFDPSVGDVQ